MFPSWVDASPSTTPAAIHHEKFKFEVTIPDRFEMAKLQPSHFSKGTVTGDY
jgi:hypothetical protein